VHIWSVRLIEGNNTEIRCDNTSNIPSFLVRSGYPRLHTHTHQSSLSSLSSTNAKTISHPKPRNQQPSTLRLAFSSSPSPSLPFHRDGIPYNTRTSLAGIWFVHKGSMWFRTRWWWAEEGRGRYPYLADTCGSAIGYPEIAMSTYRWYEWELEVVGFRGEKDALGHSVVWMRRTGDVPPDMGYHPVGMRCAE
jgi:hypothetical protein